MLKAHSPTREKVAWHGSMAQYQLVSPQPQPQVLSSHPANLCRPPPVKFGFGGCSEPAPCSGKMATISSAFSPAIRPSLTQISSARLPQTWSPPPHSSADHCSHSALALSADRRGRRGTALRCAAGGGNGGGDFEHERVVHPRPAEIQWKKELANSVQLIGTVGAPIQIKHLSSGKVLAWTRLGVKKSATETTWINLTLWDELALVAFQHVEKGQQIYVSGRLVSDEVEGEQDKRQIYYKVVVQQLNFIEKTFPTVSLYNSDNGSMKEWARTEGGRSSNHSGSVEELWQAFFANPLEWWDNRKNKRNPKYPDFKHKDTGESLWVEGKYNPSWVKSQLAVLDSRMGSFRAIESDSNVSGIYCDDLTNFR